MGALEHLETAEHKLKEAKPKSLLDDLRAQRRKLDQREPLELPIPGIKGLIAVYGPLEWEEVNEGIQKAGKSNDPRAPLKWAADLLARACIGFNAKIDGKVTPLNELADNCGDEPVRYDQDLVKAFELEDRIDPHHPARSTVMALFGNDFAVDAQATELAVWLQRGSTEADADF